MGIQHVYAIDRESAVKASAFIFPWMIFWIGWIYEKRDYDCMFYYDDRTEVTMRNEANISYLTIGFTKKGVTKRIERFCKKHYSKGEK